MFTYILHSSSLYTHVCYNMVFSKTLHGGWEPGELVPRFSGTLIGTNPFVPYNGLQVAATLCLAFMFNKEK